MAEKVVTLEQKIKSRQVQKLSRDNIRPTASVRKRNRRFKKDLIVNKRKEKRKRYSSEKKQSIKEIKQNAPDQNAINFSNSILSEEQKSLLKKGPSFVPTPTDNNWYEVRKNFIKFTNIIRHFADLDQQQEEVHPQVKSNKPTITFHLVNLLLPQIHTNNFIDLNQVQTIAQSYLLRVLQQNFLTPIILAKFETTSIKKKN